MGENEVVLRNHSNGITQGFVGEGRCADQQTPYWFGLQFHCNTANNTGTNFHSREANGAPPNEQSIHTIRGYQGEGTFGASNVFSGLEDMHFRITTTTTIVPFIRYIHASGQAPENFTQYGSGFNYLQRKQRDGYIICGAAGEEPHYIHTHDMWPELRDRILTKKMAYGNSRYLYDQLIDAGSTDEVVQEIVNSWPQSVWELRDYLLARSPYLSVTSLKELINRSYVPDAIKTEICIANPDATRSDNFLHWAEFEADYPLPGYLIQTIEDSWDTYTYRTAMEYQLAEKHMIYTQTVYQGIHCLLNDTAHAHPDTLRWVWQQLRTDGARYAEAALLLGQQKYASADSVIMAMPEERDMDPMQLDERARMLKYIRVLGDAAGVGRNEYQLLQPELDSLVTVVGLHYDRPAVWADNLLCKAYGQCRAPYTGPVGAPKSLPYRDLTRPEEALSNSTFRLQPNPTRDDVVFFYDLEGASSGTIVIRDPAGKVLSSMLLSVGTEQANWNSVGLSPGLYLVEYHKEGTLISTERLIVQQ